MYVPELSNLSEDHLSYYEIAVLVTVFNRVETTVRGLTALRRLAVELTGDCAFKIFLVDDGSTDGTGTRVRDLPLDIEVIEGTGSLYWNRGMSLAFETAQRSGLSFDAYMLYNDDIELNEEFVEFLKAFRELDDNGILVGAFREPVTGEISYSGFSRTGRVRPTSFIKPTIAGTTVPVDTFNGNLVLIPARVFEALGGLDPHYTHAYGDIDLGLRAKAIGVRSYVYGRPVGSCSRGPSLDDRIRTAAFKDRWKLLFGYPHGPASHLRFARTHGISLLFPVYVVGEIARRVRKLFWRRAPS